MHEWDKRIAPRLQNIEHCASKLDYYAAMVEEELKNLPMRPVWLTRARDTLSTSQKALVKALEANTSAIEKYDDLPVMIESFEAAE